MEPNLEDSSSYYSTIRKRSAIELHGQFFRDTILQHQDIVWAIYNLDGRLTALDLFRNMEQPEMISPEPPPTEDSVVKDNRTELSIERRSDDDSIVPVLPEEPSEYAFQIFSGTASHVERKRVAEILGKSDEYHTKVREAYMKCFDFQSQSIVDAFRYFCSVLYLTGETQAVDRILASFSKRYFQCNLAAPIVRSLYLHHEVLHILLFSMVLLNTDLHIANVAYKMRAKDFVRNTIGTLEGTAKQCAANSSAELQPAEEPPVAAAGGGAQNSNTVTSFSSMFSQSDGQTWKRPGSIRFPETAAEWRKWRSEMESHLKEIYFAIKSNRILQKSLSIDGSNMAKIHAAPSLSPAPEASIKEDSEQIITAVSSSAASSLSALPKTNSNLSDKSTPSGHFSLLDIFTPSRPKSEDGVQPVNSLVADSVSTTPTVVLKNSVPKIAELARASSLQGKGRPNSLSPASNMSSTSKRRSTIGSGSLPMSLDADTPKNSTIASFKPKINLKRLMSKSGDERAATELRGSVPQQTSGTHTAGPSVISNTGSLAEGTLPQPPTTAGKAVFQGLAIRKQLIDKDGNRARFRKWRKSWLVLCAKGENGVELWMWRCTEKGSLKSGPEVQTFSPLNSSLGSSFISTVQRGSARTPNAAAASALQLHTQGSAYDIDGPKFCSSDEEYGSLGASKSGEIKRDTEAHMSSASPTVSSRMGHSLIGFFNAAVNLGAGGPLTSGDGSQFGPSVLIVEPSGQVFHFTDSLRFRSAAPERIPLCHAVAIPLPPPGYDEKRPCVFSVVLPTNVLYLFQVPTIENAHAWCSKINIWAARKSKEPLMSGIGSAEYGWTWLQNRSGPDSAESSNELSDDELTIIDWEPFGGLGRIASKLSDEEQLAAWQRVLHFYDNAIQEHASFQKPMVQRYSQHSHVIQKAMQNWLKRYQYLIKEYKRYSIYADALKTVCITVERKMY